MSEKLKDGFTDVTEESKMKRIYRFFKSSTINPDYLYSFFIEEVISKYIKRSNSNKIIIIFDHTTLDDRFLILKFSLKVGKRAIPLWYKIFEYNEKGNKSFEHIKQGITEFNEIFNSYNYKVILLAYGGFKSIDLFRFIDKLGWKYCIRCANLCLSIAYCKVYNKNVGKIQNKNVVFPTFLFCIQRYIGTLLLEVNQYGKQPKRGANDYG
jgi:hypothetical protein